MTHARPPAADRSAALKTVVARMASEPAFAARVRDEPEAVAAEYGLDASQIATLSGATVDTRSRTHQRLEERLSRSALVFGGDMGGGDSGGGSDSGGSDSGDSDSSSRSGGDSDSSSRSGGDSDSSSRSGGDSDDGSDSSSESRSSSDDSSSAQSSSDESSSDDSSSRSSASDGESSSGESASERTSTSSEQITRDPTPEQTAAQAPAPPASAPAPDPMAGVPVAGVDPSAPLLVDPPAGTTEPPGDTGAGDSFFDLLADDGDGPQGDGESGDEGDGESADARTDAATSSALTEDPRPADPFGIGTDPDTDSGPDSGPDTPMEGARDIADAGIGGPVMAPATITAPASPLGFQPPSGETNTSYHGGQVREQVVAQNPDGTRTSVVVYGDGTTGELVRTIGPDGTVSEEVTQSDGTVATTTFGNPSITTVVIEPDGTGTVRAADFSAHTLSETDLDADGAGRNVEWTGEATDAPQGSELFFINEMDADGNVFGATSVTATGDGGAVAFVVDVNGNTVTTRLDVSEVDNADGTVSRTYLFPDGRTETFTFDGADPVAHDGLPGTDGVPAEPPDQLRVPAADDYHGGQVSSQVIDMAPDGSGTFLVHFADGVSVEMTREISPDGSLTTETYTDPDGTRVISNIGDGRGAALFTEPDGTNTTRNWDFQTLKETEIRPDGGTTATDYVGSREPATGDLLFTTDVTEGGGATGPFTLVFAMADGGARGVVTLPDGSNETVRVDVNEVENIDGTTTRIFVFPDGRNESFTFNDAGAPIAHQAFDAPGPAPRFPDPFLDDPDPDPDADDIRRTLDDLLGGVPGGGDSAGGIADLLTGALEPGPDGEPATGPLADLARVLGGGQPLGDGPLPGGPGGPGLGEDLPPGHHPGGLLPGGFDIGGFDNDGGTETTEPGRPVVETSTGPDGSETTTTTQPDGTRTEVTFAPDGTATTTSTTPDGVTTVVDTATDGTLSRTVMQPDGSFTTETQTADGARAISAQTVDGRTLGTETFPDGSTRSTVFDPASGNVTERTTFPTGTTVTITEPDGSSTTSTRLADGTTVTSSSEPNGDSIGQAIFPDGTMEIVETDEERNATITRSDPSGFTSTDRFDPVADTWTRSSGMPGGPTTVETFTSLGQPISREVVGPDGVPIPGSEPAVPPIVPDLDGLLAGFFARPAETDGGGGGGVGGPVPETPQAAPAPAPAPAAGGEGGPGDGAPVRVPGIDAGRAEPDPSDRPLPREGDAPTAGTPAGAAGPATSSPGVDVPLIDPTAPLVPGTNPAIGVGNAAFNEAARLLGGMARDADLGLPDLDPDLFPNPDLVPDLEFDLGIPDPTDPDTWSELDLRTFVGEDEDSGYGYVQDPDLASTAWGPNALAAAAPDSGGAQEGGEATAPVGPDVPPFGQIGSPDVVLGDGAPLVDVDTSDAQTVDPDDAGWWPAEDEIIAGWLADERAADLAGFFSEARDE